MSQTTVVTEPEHTAWTRVKEEDRYANGAFLAYTGFMVGLVALTVHLVRAVFSVHTDAQQVALSQVPFTTHLHEILLFLLLGGALMVGGFLLMGWDRLTLLVRLVRKAA